jgi:hypothetical protein
MQLTLLKLYLKKMTKKIDHLQCDFLFFALNSNKAYFIQ